ncbi:MAG: thioredoxin-like domain-containing protein [Fimbriiglobus sp.]
MPSARLMKCLIPSSLVVLAGFLVVGCNSSAATKPLNIAEMSAEEKLEPAPDLDGGVAWLNSAGPIKMKDLKGKIVLLDFWTLCCINCIHIMPDLAKLEKKYPNELVVIGVHSPKFDNEKDTKSIRKAVLRYEIAHPVVNDADRKIWDRYGVQSWPTMAVIDPEGNLVGALSGEGNYDVLDRAITKMIEIHDKKKTLDRKPMRFDLVRYRDKGDTPLFFPGKILADAKSNRLFVADSTHHRVVVSDLAGKVQDVIGVGSPGNKDGKFADVQFDDPQGMALDGDTLYIADRKNHNIRAADLKAKTVSTVAGVGTQVQETRMMDRPGPATKTGLNSPWDLHIFQRQMYIAMAGHHQIWKMDLDKKEIGPFAGDGRENIKDGPVYAARFAQPSGLTDDGKYLYVADSEISAIRKVPLDGEGRTDTLVGTGLFDFGDQDGIGTKAKLQHALAVSFHDGKVYVADTYNSKIKTIDPKTKEVKTLLGGEEPGTKAPLFDEPAGMSIAGGKAYIADTNAHRVRVVDLATKAVTTLKLEGLVPPPEQKEWLPPKPAK